MFPYIESEMMPYPAYNANQPDPETDHVMCPYCGKIDGLVIRLSSKISCDQRCRICGEEFHVETDVKNRIATISRKQGWEKRLSHKYPDVQVKAILCQCPHCGRDTRCGLTHTYESYEYEVIQRQFLHKGDFAVFVCDHCHGRFVLECSFGAAWEDCGKDLTHREG